MNSVTAPSRYAPKVLGRTGRTAPPGLARRRKAEVYLGLRWLRPTSRDHLCARVERESFGSVDVRVSKERTLPATERIRGDGHRNGHVDANHAHADLSTEQARRVAVAREEGHAVAVRVGVDHADRLGVRGDTRDAQHRAKDLVVVGLRARTHPVEQAGPDEEAGPVRHIGTVTNDGDPVARGARHVVDDAVAMLPRDHGTEVARWIVADPLIAKITERLDRLRVGAGDDPTSDFGPVITREHRDRVINYVTSAPSDGITIVRDGTDMADRPGFFVGPCLLDGVRPGTKAYDDEIFGPVLGVARVATYAEAVRMINANPYGNGVALFTRDGNAARLFSREVSVGMIGINVPIPVPIASYSFGGWKNSLFGHSHIYGPEGFAFYTRAKVITTRWPQPSESQIDLGFPTTR